MKPGIQWSHFAGEVVFYSLFGAIIAGASATKKNGFDTREFLRIFVFFSSFMSLPHLFDDSGYGDLSIARSASLALSLYVLCFSNLEESLIGFVPAIVALLDTFGVQITQMAPNLHTAHHWLALFGAWPVRSVTWTILLVLSIRIFRRERRRHVLERAAGNPTSFSESGSSI